MAGKMRLLLSCSYVALSLLYGSIAASAKPCELSGAWDGTLDLGILGEQRLSIDVHTDKSSVSMHTPDPGMGEREG
jgi:hypothetical protein